MESQARDLVLQAFFSVVTNVSMLPGTWLCWRLGLFVDTIVAIFSILTSCVYHVLELLESRLLGGDAGKWHVADNVFATSAFCLAALGFTQHAVPCTALDGLKTLVIGINVISQIISPWDIRYTYIPVITCVFGVAIYLVLIRKKPQLLVHWFLTALIACVVALTFFVWGLNDDRDHLRIYHGLWHVSVSLFMFAVLRATNPPCVVAMRLELHQKAQKQIASQLPFVDGDDSESYSGGGKRRWLLTKHSSE